MPLRARMADDESIEPAKTCGERQSNPHANYAKWEGRPCVVPFIFRVISRLPRRSRRRAEAGVSRITICLGMICIWLSEKSSQTAMNLNDSITRFFRDCARKKRLRSQQGANGLFRYDKHVSLSF